MPYIEAIGSPFSSLKTRPVANQQLKDGELVKVPKAKKLAVTFPYSDADKPVQAVRMVGNATDLGLKAGDIFYVFVAEWLVNDSPWKPTKPKSKSIFDLVLKRKKRYKPEMAAGDFHLVVVDDEALPTSQMECFDSKGSSLWTRKCLARGQVADWGLYSGDTPEGLYYLGQLYEADPNDAATCKPYGVLCYDMVSVENGEDAVGRAGICLHGGGSALGYPGCNADYQQLVPTFGCIRMHSIDIRDTIRPMVEKTDRTGNRVWVSVYQL